MMAQQNKRLKRGAYFQHILNPYEALPRHVLEDRQTSAPSEDDDNSIFSEGNRKIYCFNSSLLT